MGEEDAKFASIEVNIRSKRVTGDRSWQMNNGEEIRRISGVTN
jgi:hypothetical protein